MYKFLFATTTAALCVMAGDAAAHEKHTSLIEKAKADVCSQLKDCDSAKWHAAKLIKYNGKAAVCGEVNARNSYGGYDGYRGYIWEQTGDITFEDALPESLQEHWAALCQGDKP